MTVSPKFRSSAKPLTATLALALLCLTLSGCASPRVVTEYETVTIKVERLVPIDPALTQAQDAPSMDVRTWLDAVVLGIHYRHRWEACETRMSEIRGLTDGLD